MVPESHPTPVVSGVAPSFPPDGSRKPGAPIPVCPDCAGPLVRSSGCLNCTQCGWGQCG